MTQGRRSLHVPELANSHFPSGGIAWDMIRKAAELRAAGGLVDEVDLSLVRHIRPYGVAMVAALATMSVRAGNPVAYRQPHDGRACDHLARLGLPSLVGLPGESQAAVRATNFPIRVIETRSDDVGWDISQMLIGELGEEVPGGVQPAIAENIDEMILNALTHAESAIGCVVVGQAFPQTGCLEVAILDLGMTIRGHLSEKFPDLADDSQAILRAMEDGITGTKGRNRFKECNSGAGLYNLREYLSSTGGELAILSGSAIVWMDGQGNLGKAVLYGQPFNGTLVNVVFPTRPGRTGVGPVRQADL